ncbi:hypothetical protein [Chroococcidiopsis sp. SAG 2025]|nr:hypothetical protein [Chroococcidiopsis sp. SAG 2025]
MTTAEENIPGSDRCQVCFLVISHWSLVVILSSARALVRSCAPC